MNASLGRLVVAAALAVTALVTGCAEDGTMADDTSAAEASARPRFELWEDRSDRYVFQLVSPTGEALLDSQTYTSRSAALAGLTSVLANGTQRARYTIVVDADRRAHVELRAANGQVSGTGQPYDDRAGASRALVATIAAVKAYPRPWTAGHGPRFAVLDADGGYRFALHDAGEAIILRSTTYASLAATLNGALSVVDHGANPARFELRPVAAGGYYVALTASNGQGLATSDVYATEADAEAARAAIMALLPKVSVL
jgi:uncharacterized protein YegP (UPF0339 family)